MRNKITLTLLVSVFSILMMSALTDSFEALADMPTVKATGTLTSIEDDGKIIIDEKGYALDPSAIVINRKGKSVSLRSISLPAPVRFEYVQATTGFIIVFIEEVKNSTVKTKRSQR